MQSPGSGSALRSAGPKLISLLFGLGMMTWTWLPWLWLQLVRTRRGSARLVRVRAHDLWGHDPHLTLAVDSAGKVLSLPWQLSLMVPLVTGRIRLLGPKAVVGQAQYRPETPREMVGFWRQEPTAPGLIGPWARPSHSTDHSTDHSATDGSVSTGEVAEESFSSLSFINSLWCAPGGFGVIGNDDLESGRPDQARTGPEVS